MIFSRNIICCLLAKKLGARHTIARIRNPEYNNTVRLIKDELGLSMSINPEQAAAREILRAIRFSNSILRREELNLLKLR